MVFSSVVYNPSGAFFFFSLLCFFNLFNQTVDNASKSTRIMIYFYSTDKKAGWILIRHQTSR